jgi:hypothetical protein
MHKLILLLIPFLLIAQNQPVKSPEEIQAELDAAEAQFRKAEKMFNPWYTGPLITPSATMMPPGECNIQPYIFVTDKYASYDEDRHVKGHPALIQLQGSATILTGVTDSMDFILGVNGVGNWQKGHSGGGYGDMSTTLGFLINRETRYAPKAKFTVSQSYPTGRYQHLYPTGLNSSGAGAWGTTFGFALGKLFFYTTPHPFNVRLFTSYQIWTTVHVEGFNTYGGGYGTRGKVRPGQTFSADLGMELSLTQHWVAALDVVYTASQRTRFHGHSGVTKAGTPAGVGGGSNDNLSLAPAIEYNWSSNLGIIFGGWFSVYGRNSSAFGSGIISVTYTFP